MTNTKFILVLIAMLLVAALGVAALLLTDTVGGPEFGQGKSVLVMFEYVEETESETLENEINNTFAEMGLKPQTTRYYQNIIGGNEGVMYSFGDLTDAQLEKISKIQNIQNVKSVTVQSNNAVYGNHYLLWGGVALAIAVFIYGVILAFATKNLGRAAMTTSALTVLVATLLTSLAVSMLLAYFGIKVTVASIGANIAVALYTMLLSTIIITRLAKAKEGAGQVFAELKKPVMFATIAALVGCLAFAASLSYYVVSAALPLFAGVLFASLANMYVLMPIWSKLANK